MSTQKPTPRTDAFIGDQDGTYMTEGEIAMCNFARILERELTHAKSENEAMRAAIQEAATAFDAIILSFDDEATWVTRDVPANALAALKPFLPETPCQPGE